MAHGDAREGKWRGKLANGAGSQYSHTPSERGISSITTADAHNSAASIRLNWRPCRFKWTHPFWGKTISGFCACANTFQTRYTSFSSNSSVLLSRPLHQMSILVYHSWTINAVCYRFNSFVKCDTYGLNINGVKWFQSRRVKMKWFTSKWVLLRAFNYVHHYHLLPFGKTVIFQVSR